MVCVAAGGAFEAGFNMTLTEFHFLRPYWFFALIPLGLIVWRLSRQLYRAENWRAACDEHLLQHLITQNNIKQSFTPFLLVALAWLLTIIALAGPTWSRLPQPVYQSQNARIILLDLNQSMFAQDIKPNRLARTKYKLLDMLKQLDDGQTGLIAFTSEPYVVSPLTQDTRTIASMVPVLTPNIMPVQGSNISAALEKAADLFKQANIREGQIFLMTDSTPDQQDEQVATKLAREGYETSVLGIGTVQGAPIPKQQGGFVTSGNGQTSIAKLNVVALQSLAESGDGRYATFTNSNQDLSYILKPALVQHLSNAKKTKAVADIWRDEGRWLILLILPLALLAFRRGWMREVAQ